jgi:glycosyltransferase involved in cell wall biosynthesis
MNIGIIVEFAPPEFGAAVIRIMSFAKYFKSKGNHVTIFAPDRNDRYQQQYEGVDIIRYKDFWNLLNIFSRNEINVLVASTPPATIPFLATTICKIMNIPIIVDVRDPWTYAKATLGELSTKKFEYKKYYLLEKISYLLADKLFVVSPYLRNLISSKFGIPLKKFSIVINGTETSKFRRVEHEGIKVRNKLRIPLDVPVIIYTGILGGKELDCFLHSCGKEIVKKFNCHIVFTVIIDRWSKSIANELRNIARKIGIEENFHMLGPIPSSEMYKYLSSSDLGINPLPDGMDYCLPVKTFDYLACEVPIACKAPAGGSLHQFMQEYDVGFFADTWIDFKERLFDALENLKEFKKKGIYGRKVVEKKYSRKIANEIAFKEINKIMSE